MRVQSVVPWIAVVGTLTSWSLRAAVGQGLTLAPRTLRFFYASSTAAKPVEIDVSHNAVLGRVVSLHVQHTTIGGLLAEIQRQTALTFAYDPHFPSTRPVTLEAESITVASALGAILAGTGVDVVLTETGHVWLTESTPGTPRVQEGTIVGRVTDKQRGDPIIGATVVLAPIRQSATTGTDGRYRFANLSPGKYTVRARYIGYGSLLASVAVGASQEVTVDFPLVKSPRQLDEIVTTGTVVPTEVKALPTPVTVVTDSEIALQRPSTVMELFRQAVPTAVSWDQAAAPYNAAFSARGATTLAGQIAQMKIFVDGIETAVPALAIDPNSIERMEVIRGPQAAAIYGSDAIGGVVQFFTKRGDPSRTRPQLTAEASMGLAQTPYAGFNDVLRQGYAASLRGGSTETSYSLIADYSHTADWIPNGEQSAQSKYGVSGSLHYARGLISFDLTGRYFVQNVPVVGNPDFVNTGFFYFSQPNHQPDQFATQTIGAQLGVTPTHWWRNTVRIGSDRYTNDYTQTQRRLTYPGDTLLLVLNSNVSKTFVAYNTAVEGSLASGLSGSLMAGFDHYYLPNTSFSSFGTLTTTGSIQTAPSFPLSATRTITKNTGYFTQVQLGYRDALFLTGGLRAERNTNFGESLSTPMSPRIGISYVQPVGAGTLKLRGSWGRAIRAPTPGMREAGAGAFGIGVTLANLTLGPERQHGWDAGVDATFGDRSSLSFTYYDQIAQDLIQYVQLQAIPVPTSQYQNVGRVKNTGVEIEGMLAVGTFRLKAQYGYARARIDQLAPSYSGDLREGDQTLATPRHTAGASLTVLPFRRTTVSAGFAYVGRWTNYDYFAQFSCFGGTGPCQASSRGYIVEYPAFAKVNMGISQQISPLLSGFMSVDNLADNRAFEVNNISPVIGRVTTVGLRLQY